MSRQVFKNFNGNGTRLSENNIVFELQNVLEDRKYAEYAAATLFVKIYGEMMALTVGKTDNERIDRLLAQLYLKHKSPTASYYKLAQSLV